MTDVFSSEEARALELDRQDQLDSYRDRFYMPGDAIYLDGNSLGLLSRDAESSVLQALESWKRLAIRGWMSADPPWFTLAEELAGSMARLIGAGPESVIVTGTTTINLHQMVGTFYKPADDRRKILATSLDFPSDIYALQSQIRLRGGDPERDLVLVESRDGRMILDDDIIAAMGADVALVLLPSVLYRSGQLLDIPRLVSAAHERGILIGLDCAHSVGAIPHELDAWGVDFAVWCTYKYLNAGPGSVGGLYVHSRHFGTDPALAGWWGYRKDRQFEMSHEWEGAGHAGAFQISTVPLLSAAPLLGALSLHLEAGIAAIREKSLRQTDYLIHLMQDSGLLDDPFNFRIGTPREHNRRGGHIAIEHPDAGAISQALIERDVIVDFRQPDVIRLAPVALYTSYRDIWRTVQVLKQIVERGEYLTATRSGPVT